MLKRSIAIFLGILLIMPSIMMTVEAETNTVSGRLRITELEYNGAGAYPQVAYGYEDGSGGLIGGRETSGTQLFVSSAVYLLDTPTYTLPEFLKGQTFIKVDGRDANDKKSTASNFISFEVNRNVTVYIGMESRTLAQLAVNGNPSPVASYIKTKDEEENPVSFWGNGGLKFELYQKNYNAGDIITIAGNASTDTACVPYVPIIIPRDGDAGRNIIFAESFYCDGETKITSLSGNNGKSVEAAFEFDNLTEQYRDTVLVTAVYNNGYLINTKVKNEIIPPGYGIMKNDSVVIDAPSSPSTAYEIISFAWEGLENNIPMTFLPSVLSNQSQHDGATGSISAKPSIQDLKAVCIGDDITITGKTSDGKRGVITAYVKSADGRSNYLYQKASEENGSFAFLYKSNPAEFESGEYTVYVNGVDEMFYFSDINERADITTHINNAKTFADMKSVIEANKKVLSIVDEGYIPDICEFLIYNRDTILKRNYNNILEIYDAVEEAIIIAEIKTAGKGGIIAVLKKYSRQIEIDIDDDDSDYKRLGNIGKEQFAANFANRTGYKTLSDIKKVFKEEMLIPLVNDTYDYNYIGTILVEYDGIIGLGADLSAYLNDLSDLERSEVNKAVISEIRSTAAEIKDAASNKIKEIKNRKKDTGKTAYSGGGSGSSKSTISITQSNVSQQVEVPSPVAVAFHDVPQNHWAWESIYRLAALGVVAGYGKDEFKPDDIVSREQFIKMLIEGFKLTDQSAICTFGDILQGEWYYPYVASAQKYGIVMGMENGNFGQGQEITRQEMAVLAYRTAQFKGVDLPRTNLEVSFDDEHSIEDYAKAAVGIMQQAGIINGVGDNRFAPAELSNRAQASKIIFELLQVAQGAK
ncbi:MAG: S-layer homology domain-containing protein [Firmicutes bacterium]|nr:S-layer homology domain-containing protein [Bacillota bacterium]